MTMEKLPPVVAALLLALNLGPPLPGLHGVTDEAETGENASRLWGGGLQAGGGTALAFADDMEAPTAAHHAAWQATRDYYGGAVPEPGDGPQRWAQDLFRWGRLPATAGAWAHGAGAWRFGTTQENSPAYAAGVLAELVSPVIDLRAVPKAEARPVQLQGPSGLNGMGGRCEDFGSLGCPTLTQAEQAYYAAAPEGERELAPSVPTARAALVVRHRYDFLARSEFLDGGRVEASAFDEALGAWTPWVGLPTVDGSLRVRNGTLSVRSDGSQASAGSDGSADAYLSGNQAQAGRDSNGSVYRNGPSRPEPHLYAGTISASGPSSWEGFGGVSGGSVDSLFDLSPLAGHFARLRFVAATQGSDSPLTHGNEGWSIEDLAVHADLPDGIDIVALADPGDGTVLAEGATVEPKVLLRNRGSQPTEVRVVADLDGRIEAAVVRLGAGPLASAVAATGHLVAQAGLGLHALRVDVTTQEPAGPSADAAAFAPPASTTFHWMVAEAKAGGWKPSGLRLAALGTGEDGNPVESVTRFLQSRQAAVIRVDIENLEPTPQTVRAGASGESGNWDLRPALVDEAGVAHGTVEVLPGTPKALEVPPTRELSGTHGLPRSASQLAWRWHDESGGLRPLRLVLHRQAGGVASQVLDGGPVLVQSVQPPLLDVDLGNLWTATGGACDRKPLEEKGVLACTAQGGQVLQLASTQRQILPIDLARGNVTSARLVVQGGPLQVHLQSAADPDPRKLARPGAAWTDLASAELAASTAWRTLVVRGAALPDGFSGHLRILVASSSSFTLDAASLTLNLTGEGNQNIEIPLLHQDWDTVLERQLLAVEANSPSGLVHLTGQDEATSGLDEPSLQSGKTSVDVEDGTVHVRVNALSDADRFNGYVASGRVLEDSLLAMPLVDLRGAVRPVLEFREWHDVGQHGYAVVEAARAPPPETGAAALDRSRGLAPGDWRPLAVAQGSSDGLETSLVRLSLASEVGHQVFLRFRYHLEPTILSRPSPPDEGGWIVEDVRVTAWKPEGVEVLHEPEPEFADYQLHGARFEPKQVTFSDSNCWSLAADKWALGRQANPCGTWYGTSVLVTGPLEIGAMDTPYVAIRHEGILAGASCNGWSSYSDYDLEYRVLSPDGTWPARWHRFNPHSAAQGPLGRFVDPETREEAGLPFSNGYKYADPSSLQFYIDCENARGSVPFPDHVDRFDLSRLMEGSDRVVVQLRIHAWVEFKNRISSGSPYGRVGTINVTAIKVADFRDIVNGGATGLGALEDDRQALAAVAGKALAGLAPFDEIVLSHDQATVDVGLQNTGRVPLDLAVSLQAVNATGTSAAVNWVRLADGQEEPTLLQTGYVHLEPRSAGVARFRVDLTDAPPGRYRLTASVNPVNGVDTDPSNDRAARDLVVLPFRDLRVEAQASGVSPFAAAAEQARSVRVRVANGGNVDEREVHVRAQIVRMTGLSTFANVTPGLPEGFLAEQVFSLAGRGAGVRNLQWVLDPSKLPLPPETYFQPGETYALKVTVEAAPGSVKAWWGADKDLPIQVTRNQTALAKGLVTGLLDASRPSNARCGCFLVPFLVERTLWDTDLTAGNSTSILPAAFPIGTPGDPAAGWQAVTLLDGKPVRPQERPDLPSFRVADGQPGVTGATTGKVWSLSPYEGLEEVENQLLSPVLPAHVVAAESRAILGMRYGTEAGFSGQAFLESRRLVGGRWTDWEPTDALRSKRIAIVLAPDFPLVLPTGLDATTPLPLGQDYTVPALQGHHPLPPFYGDKPFPHIQPSGFAGPDDHAPSCFGGLSKPLEAYTDQQLKSADLCVWTQPPVHLREGNEEWVEALNATLAALADSFGEANVALFTTISPALGVGQPQGSGLVYTMLDAGTTRQFPIRSLEELGNRLDSYGTILLMGDNTTATFAHESAILNLMRHGPDDWASHVPAPDSVAVRHHDDLFEILNAAKGSGVRVMAALGPAVGTLGASKAVAGVPVAVWQPYSDMPVSTHPSMLAPFLARAASETGFNLHCTGNQTTFGSGAYGIPDNLEDTTPLGACVAATDTQGSAVIGFNDHHNYYRISPYDAVALRQRELAPSFLAHHGLYIRPTGVGDCLPVPPHPRAQSALFFVACLRFDGTHATEADGLAVVTAARPEPAILARWIGDIQAALAQADGTIPPSAGQWQDLPPTLAFPVGGDYVRVDGTDRFEGAPSQFRVRVRADPDAGGHGAFAVSRLTLLGTNRTRDLDADFIEPQDLFSPYGPGRAFAPIVQVTNRGVERSPETVLSVQLAPGHSNDGRCLPAASGPVSVDVPPLEGGEQVVLEASALNGGEFPKDPGCGLPLHEQDFTVLYTADLPERAADEDPSNDRATVTVRGRELVRLHVEGLEVFPREGVLGPEGLSVQAKVGNLGTQTQVVRLQARLDPARPLPCWKTKEPGGLEGDMYGCDGMDRVVAPVPLRQPDGSASTNPAVFATLGRRQEATLTLSLQPAGDLPPGDYRLSLQVATDAADQATLVFASQTPVVHVTADEDPRVAVAKVPPDGGFAYVAQNATHLDELAIFQGIAGSGWHPSGFYTELGQYRADSMVRDQERGVTLEHGWRVGADCLDCPPGVTRYVEWLRSATPAFRVGVDPASWPDSDGSQSTDSKGQGDFGPDTLVWNPFNPLDVPTLGPANPVRVPYLSLAGYDDPALNLLTKFDGPPNTAFVVEMQLARRVNCKENGPQGGPPPGTDCNSVQPLWAWDTGWLPLATPDAATSAPILSPSEETGPQCLKQLGCPGGQGQVNERKIPSNPLAGKAGLWGQHSGVQAEDDGWVRLRYPIDLGDAALRAYCNALSAQEAKRLDRNACLYAYAMGAASAPVGGDGNLVPHGPIGPDTFVARPVRFRFSAASFGGDAGLARWQVADVSLGQHDVGFPGPATALVRMPDSSVKVVPVRVHNAGTVEDDVLVSYRPPTGRTVLNLGAGGGVDLARTPGFSDPGPEIRLHLEPNATKVAWLRIRTGILERAHPGSEHPVPFLVRVQSLRDPTANAERLIDASFTSRSWPNLEAVDLALNGNIEREDPLAAYSSPVGVPLQPTLVLRNNGAIAMGTLPPIPATLQEEEFDCATFAPVGAARTVGNATLQRAIAPYQDDPQDILVTLPAWVPGRVGCFRLEARVNGGLAAVPEASLGDNVVSRRVAVGPVKSADLHVVGLDVVPFQDGCQDGPVALVLAGHSYCLVATVENRGREPALDARALFSLGNGGPFSTPCAFPDPASRQDCLPFPAANETTGFTRATVTSSPRVLQDRSDGAWRFVAEATSKSIFRNFENKTRALDLPVLRYGLKAAGPGEATQAAAGGMVLVPVDVENIGNQPATPVLGLAGDSPGFYAVPVPGPLLQPGEKAVLRAAVLVDPDPPSSALPALRATLLEDPLVRVDVDPRVNLTAVRGPAAHALQASSAAGLANVTLALEGGTLPVSWRVLDATAPLRVPARSWLANGTLVVSLPAQLVNGTAPGTYTSLLQLRAQAGEAVHRLTVPVELVVAPEPRLAVSSSADRLTLLRGTEGRLVLHLRNDGNVPVAAWVNHTATGALVAGGGRVVVEPGSQLDVPVGVQAVQARAAGQSTVEWSQSGRKEFLLDWTVEAIDARVAILDSGLASLRPAQAKETVVAVRLHNPDARPVEAEALLLVDGIVQSVVRKTLAGHANATVDLPFVAGAAGAGQQVVVLARPAGSRLAPGDEGFFEVGAADSAVLVPDAAGGKGALGIPAPSPAWLLAAVALLLRRRRRA